MLNHPIEHPAVGLTFLCTPVGCRALYLTGTPVELVNSKVVLVLKLPLDLLPRGACRQLP